MKRKEEQTPFNELREICKALGDDTTGDISEIFKFQRQEATAITEYEKNLIKLVEENTQKDCELLPPVNYQKPE